MAFEAIRKITKKLIRIDANKLINSLLETNQFQSIILNLNRVDQLFLDGIQSDGNPLTSNNSTPGVYSNLTQFLNDGVTFSFAGESKQKIEGEPYFLFSDGDFYSTFVIRLGNDYFEIDADPIRDDTNIFEEFGREILGLTDENTQLLIDFMRSELIDKIQQEITKAA